MGKLSKPHYVIRSGDCRTFQISQKVTYLFVIAGLILEKLKNAKFR